MLEHDPSYAGSHYALALVAARQGERARATEELVRAARYWSQADADLAELQDAKAKLEAARRE